jgi:tetratricopeptide (TPR) repeat protein
MIKPGTVLQDQYRIVRRLGQGGMGAVYEAIDEELSCLVAIKETLVETDELKRKFRKEASLLANLDHPTLPKVRRHFVEGNSQFLVMDYIEGDDLASLLEKRDGNPFQAAKVLVWADQLLDALEELHSRRPPIIHHDIKPSNLKLKSKVRIILLDFGLARGVAGQMPHTISEYRSKNIHGYTRGYAPKEQILKQGTDARADLYSLAATLWTLLTGEVPPDALERIGETDDGNLDPLRSVNEINPQVPLAVAAVLQKALSLSREQRYADATEMRRALREARIEEFYQVAQLAMKDEEWGKAVEHLQFIHELDPFHRDVALLLHQAQQQQQLSTMYAEGREHLEAGRTREALELFQRIDSIQDDYKDAPALIEKIQSTIAQQEVEALYASALQEMAQEKWALAIEQLQKALDLSPSHAQAKLKLDYARQQRDLILLYHAALKHYEDGRWHEALDDLRRIKEIDENYRDIVNLIENCQRKIEEQRIASHIGEVQQVQAVASQSTADRKSPEIGLATAEAPVALNVLSSKEDSSQEKEGSSKQKKGKLRSKLILGVAALVIGALVIAAAATIIRSRQAKAAEEQYQIAESLVIEARQKRAEAEAAARPRIVDPNAKIVLGGKEVQIVSGPDSAQANALLKESQKKNDQAEAALREAIRLNPNNAAAHFKLGDILDAKQRPTEAEAAYREGLRLNPDNAEAHNSLGVILDRQKKYAEAEAEYRTTLRLNPNNFLAYNNLGNILLDQMKDDEAEAAFRESIRLNPDYDYAHLSLGHLLSRNNKYAEAEAEYRVAIGLSPYDARGHFGLGGLFSFQRKYTEAIAEYREAIRLDLNNPLYHSTLGNVLHFQKKYAEAEAEYRKVVQLDPDNALGHNDLARALGLQKKYAEAEDEAREAVRLDPNNALYQSTLGIALYFRKKYAEAEAAAEEAVRLEPSNSSYTQLLKTIKARR